MNTDFNKIRDEVKEKSIVSFLSEMNYEPAKETNNNYKYSSPLRSEKTPSFIVSKAENRWVDFGGSSRSGDIIDLAKLLWKTDYRETVIRLSKTDYPLFEKTVSSDPEKKEYEVKEFIIEVKKGALLSYLKKRGIDPNKVKGLVGELHFKFDYHKKHLFSLAFKNDLGGYDLRNDMRLLNKITLGPKHFTHIKRGYSTLTMFEGFIDFLSLESDRPLKSDILVLNSCSLVPKSIPILKDYDKVYLMLDRDDGGNFATNMVQENSTTSTKDLRYLFEGFNDVNEWIVSKQNQPNHDPQRA